MSVLVSVKRVANNQLHGELSDVVEKPGVVNVLALLNKGDKRFKIGSDRLAWFPVTTMSLEEMGISTQTIAQIDALKEGEKIELNFPNPKINGQELKIQVMETITPDVWQQQNTMKAAKQLMINEDVAKNTKISDYSLSKYLGQNGYFLTEDGNFIFSRTTVTVKSQLKHELVTGVLVPEMELNSYGATLANGNADFKFAEQEQEQEN